MGIKLSCFCATVGDSAYSNKQVNRKGLKKLFTIALLDYKGDTKILCAILLTA